MIKLQNRSEPVVEIGTEEELREWLGPTWVGELDHHQKACTWLMKTKVPFVFDTRDQVSFLASLHNCDVSLAWEGKRKAFCFANMTRTYPALNDLQNLKRWEEWASQELLEKCRSVQYALRDVQLVAAVLNDIDALVAADIRTQEPRGARGWYETFLHDLLGGVFKFHEIWKGVLERKDFLGLLVDKNLPLDPGADRDFYTMPENRASKKHGALSHVFQLLIIQEAITHPGRSESENASRYKSLQSCNLADFVAEIAGIKFLAYDELSQNVIFSLWDIVFDLAPYKQYGIQQDATMPEGITTFVEAREEKGSFLFPGVLDLEITIERAYTMKLGTVTHSEFYGKQAY